MSAEFCATSVSIEEHQGDRILALFNDEDQYLFFQAPIAEAQRGDGVYLELNDEAHGGYDVLASVTLDQNSLTLALKSPLTGMPTVTAVSLSLQIPEGQLLPWSEALQNMFEGRFAELDIQLG